MEKKEIIVESINVKEALRYLGYNNTDIDPNMKELLSHCEKELLSVIRPDYIYSIFELNEDFTLASCDFELVGKSIKDHVRDCKKVIFMCATAGSEVDRLIRMKQVGNMAEATVIDSMASACVEQICDKIEEVIKEDFPNMDMTWRFGLGYGDFPLELQKKFLEVLQAPKRIGVCVSNSMMLTPTKSVTCVIGLKEKSVNVAENDKNYVKCDFCNMRDNCQYRLKGEACHGD